jgi:carbon monoxide dehydrogenase subunit G
MQVSRRQTLPVPRDIAWAALVDVKVLKACIPGCESIHAVSANEFSVTVVAAIGPIRARFKGKLELRRQGDAIPPESYSLHFDGHGGFAGHASGEAYVQLQPDAEGNTILQYAARATVAGRIAGVGAHFIDMAAQELADIFFTSFNEHMRQRTPTTTN